MALGYVTTLRNTRLDAITTAIGSSGKLRVFSGTKPATGGAETTLLASLPLSATAAAAASAGVLTLNAITNDTNAAASGTPTWARLTTSANGAVVDMTAGVGSGDLNFNAAIVATGIVSCSSFVITDGTS